MQPIFAETTLLETLVTDLVNVCLTIILGISTVNTVINLWALSRFIAEKCNGLLKPKILSEEKKIKKS